MSKQSNDRLLTAPKGRNTIMSPTPIKTKKCLKIPNRIYSGKAELKQAQLRIKGMATDGCDVHDDVQTQDVQE